MPYIKEFKLESGGRAGESEKTLFTEEHLENGSLYDTNISGTHMDPCMTPAETSLFQFESLEQEEEKLRKLWNTEAIQKDVWENRSSHY